VRNNADDLASAAEQTSRSITAMATATEQVAANADNMSGLADQVASAVEETARSVEGVAQNAETIARSAESAASSVTELDRSMRSVAALTGEATEISRRATRDAEEGGTAVQRSLEGLGRVRSSMAESATVVKEVGRRASEISTIVDTINLIAERTNLLSLNASIEAARAGEAGRGFAVVAEEIRNLADRSAKATADIASIIKALQSVVQDAVSSTTEGQRVAEESGRLGEEGAAGLRRIVSGIEQSSQKVAQIARATDEQLGAAQDLVTVVGTVTGQVRQVSVASKEQANALQGLVRMTGQMRNAAREVTKAMEDQERSAREIVKAADGSASLASQVRRAMAEQAAAAAEQARRDALSPR
jgi:methyl-accepting chemotaxis protein